VSYFINHQQDEMIMFLRQIMVRLISFSNWVIKGMKWQTLL